MILEQLLEQLGNRDWEMKGRFQNKPIVVVAVDIFGTDPKLPDDKQKSNQIV